MLLNFHCYKEIVPSYTMQGVFTRYESVVTQRPAFGSLGCYSRVFIAETFLQVPSVSQKAACLSSAFRNIKYTSGTGSQPGSQRGTVTPASSSGTCWLYDILSVTNSSTTPEPMWFSPSKPVSYSWLEAAWPSPLTRLLTCISTHETFICTLDTASFSGCSSANGKNLWLRVRISKFKSQLSI